MNAKWIFVAFASLLVAACGGQSADSDRGGGHEHAQADKAGSAEHGHGHAEHGETEMVRGPNGGRLLQQDGYALELAVAEAGVPPHYRAWISKDGKPLPAAQASVSVTVKRLGGVSETHVLKPEGDSLSAATELYEPHSFDVGIEANIAGKALHWEFPSYEGRTTISAGIAQQAGIRTAAAAAGAIRDEHEVQGLITPVEGRHARVVARFPGPVREVRASIGDSVKAGQVLAVIESNVSLSNYSVTAPFSGTVLARSAAVGDLAGETPLFEIADLSRLWVDLHLFGADAQHITPGLPVEVIRLSDGVSAATTLDRVLPGTATASQSTVARAKIDNADGRWRTGAAVRARVTVSVKPVALQVPLSALQKFRDWDVVFIRVGDTYEVRPLALGARDANAVEVLQGLKPGDEVVIEQSYVVKADIEKSGAGHDH